MLQLIPRLNKVAAVLIFGAMVLSFNLHTASAQAIDSSLAGTDSGGSVSFVPIGSNDSLNITVVGESDLTNTYIVDSSGDISLLYVGKIHVAGLSLDQATTLIQKKLGQIYTSPRVSVVRPAVGGITVYVTGAVNKQGDNQLRRDAHLNDVIQLSAPTAEADLQHIEVTSGEPGQPHRTATYDLTTFLNAGSTDGNPPLSDGDQIFVPRITSESVSVIGYVVKPGRYAVQPGETVFELISSAGGLLPTADSAGIYLKEMGSDAQTPFDFTTAAQNPGDPQFNPVLKDGDEVIVPLTSATPSYALLGAVLKPGEYQLHGQVSLLDAIADAGGLEDRAQAKKTTVTRTTAKGPVVLVVDAEDTKKAALFYLQAGDNITIPHGAPASQLNVFSGLGVLGTILGILRI